MTGSMTRNRCGNGRSTERAQKSTSAGASSLSSPFDPRQRVLPHDLSREIPQKHMVAMIIAVDLGPVAERLNDRLRRRAGNHLIVLAEEKKDRLRCVQMFGCVARFVHQVDEAVHGIRA